jgi:16S rRNA (guanine527-N7)-methyltransferase
MIYNVDMSDYIRQYYNYFLPYFEKYKNILKEWNEKINLTAITDDKEIFEKHFKDSLLGEKYIKKGSSVLDIGTGAGFPSLPIKIVREDINLTLNDSLNKRIVFLDEVIKELGLKNVKTIHSRAEDLNKEEKYDYVLSRAVAKLNTLSEYCLPFVKLGGYFIAYKSKDTDEEIKDAEKAIKILGGEIEKTEEIPLNEETVRRLIFIKKIKECENKYPRGKNLPKTKPII